VASSRPALVLLAAWLAACSNGNAVASPASRGSNATKKGSAQMASTDPDIAVAQHAIAQDLHVPEAAVKIRPLDVTVPGVLVFSASVDPAKAGRPVTRTGVIDGGKLYVEAEAMARVARAWKYGTKRTVPAATLAEVFGALHNATAGSSAILDEDTVETYKKVSGPRRAAAVAIPAETTVDGLPAVVYCLTSSARATPFSVVTAVVKPDYKVELHAQPVLED
jgi:hypothetical protein